LLRKNCAMRKHICRAAAVSLPISAATELRLLNRKCGSSCARNDFNSASREYLQLQRATLSVARALERTGQVVTEHRERDADRAGEDHETENAVGLVAVVL